MECELCGSRNADRKAKLEGAVLNVCRGCASMGEKVDAPRKVLRTARPMAMPEEMDMSYVPDFYRKMRSARQRRGLTQEQVAEKSGIRVSFVKRMEEGWRAPLALARRVEKFLGIQLIEKVEGSMKSEKKKPEAMTIGDIIEVSK